jgi:DNA-binding PadR family transcriptional regulator
LILNPEEDRTMEILLLLAQKGPLNKYGICKVLVPKYGSEPTILYAVRDLTEEKRGIGAAIRVAKTERGARGPKGTSNYYDLTPSGLAHLLNAIAWDLKNPGRDFFDFFGHLAAKYLDLFPEIFNLWPAFVDAGIADLFIQRFKYTCKHSDDLLSENALYWFLAPSWADRALRERWLKGINRIESIRPYLAHILVMQALDDIKDSNKQLQMLTSEQIVLIKQRELTALEGELNDLKLKMDILEHATGYSIKPAKA